MKILPARAAHVDLRKLTFADARLCSSNELTLSTDIEANICGVFALRIHFKISRRLRANRELSQQPRPKEPPLPKSSAPSRHWWHGGADFIQSSSSGGDHRRAPNTLANIPASVFFQSRK